MSDFAYQKITRELEDNIIGSLIRADELIPSTNEISEFYKINPGTAAKGVAPLLRDGIIYKKRGVGLFVAEGAREKLLEKRRNDFREEFLTPLLGEAKKLNISKRDLIAMLTAE